MTSVRGLPHPIHATDISPLSNTIAFGGADGMVKIMKIAEVEDKTELPSEEGSEASAEQQYF